MKAIRWPRLLLLPFQFLFLAHSANSLIITKVKWHPNKIYKSSRVGLAAKLSQTSEKNQSDADIAYAREMGDLKEIKSPKHPSPQPARSANAREMMVAMRTSPRRIFLSLSSSAGIALVGNLFGVTSSVLNKIDEDIVESTGLDSFYPRGDFKRHKSADYTFVIPKEWVADTAVELAKAQRRTQPLDYKMRQASGGTLPDAAFGPPGRLDSRGVSQGDTNVSVIQSPFSPGFSLRDTMKTPTEGALFLLNNSIAPPESNRKATLLDASEQNGIYRFEYRVDLGGGRLALRSISAVAQAQRYLYTMTVVAPEQDWISNKAYEMKLRKIAESFHLR